MLTFYNLPTDLQLWDECYKTVCAEHEMQTLSHDYLIRLVCAGYEYAFLESLQDGEPYKYCPNRTERDQFRLDYLTDDEK